MNWGGLAPSNAKALNAANDDEAKANSFSNSPEVLTRKDGTKVAVLTTFATGTVGLNEPLVP